MIPREYLGSAHVPGGQELKLYRRGKDHMIVLDRNELMSSRMSGSEKQLALMTIERLKDRRAPHLLVGGYAMGFTLRAALGVLDGSARVTMAELVPEIIEWARGPMVDLMDGCLDDPRVELLIEDVVPVIGRAHNRYDAILLDVDNGPDGLTAAANDRLYSAAGLEAAKAALRPGGILAIWSAGSDDAFTRRLRQSGYLVDEVAVKARDNGKGPRHVIWFATKR
ncbi:MAG: spermidine synthase [Sphingobium sp.]|uniref:spermidine synthase n=1 Tax=Sphingobium sp. TaxID=1912891 RepID=UPI000DB65F51|nr:spermidine synthase [Sphingobium sp.]PZU12506.1 MAG: spermidine synthase [Sphingobium sp.]